MWIMGNRRITSEFKTYFKPYKKKFINFAKPHGILQRLQRENPKVQARYTNGGYNNNLQRQHVWVHREISILHVVFEENRRNWIKRYTSRSHDCHAFVAPACVWDCEGETVWSVLAEYTAWLHLEIDCW